jgi:hypothetical protein
VLWDTTSCRKTTPLSPCAPYVWHGMAWRVRAPTLTDTHGRVPSCKTSTVCFTISPRFSISCVKTGGKESSVTGGGLCEQFDTLD